MKASLGAEFARIWPPGMDRAVPATTRDRYRVLPIPNTPKKVREVVEAVGDHVDDVALALHASPTRYHAGRQHNPALFLEQARPDSGS